MKTTHFLAAIALLFMINGAGSLLAQPGAGQHGCKKQNFGKGTESGIPNLTEEQQSKIKEFRITHFKEMQTYRNQLGELRARERTLTTADKPDMKAINANIDEITKVQNQMMKSRAAHQQQVRALLTDEQKLWFDAHGMNKAQKNKRRNNMDYKAHGDGCKVQG